ncbi:MAG TPA: DNA repair protein RecN [Actinomycetota bacterium]|nr:DNA repair protein RecN [Actinomycetota bacterium]
MLVELHIAGLGVIEDVTLELPPGLSVLTGETGAGKTMVIGGLALVLGGRALTGVVRPGAKRAGVEARFDVRGTGAAREWADDGELVLARSVTAEGRSTARVGGQLAPVSTLSELGTELVEVHGQRQAERLSSPIAQLAFLDRFCGPPHLDTLAAYREAHRSLRRARERLRALDDQEREREREKDLLAYQVREIEAADVRPGEVAELEAEAARLGNAERLGELVAAAVAALTAEGGGEDAVRTASAATREIASVDPAAADLAARLASMSEEVADVASTLRGYGDALEADPARLEDVRERLAAVRALERKYGEGESAVLAFLESARIRLAGLERSEEERAELGEAVATAQAEVDDLADRLGRARREAAPRLAAALRAELAELGMADASVDVVLEGIEDPGPDGRETVTMVFAGGPGQEPQPLGRVASGGELSRMMLACRTVLADLDDVPTLVFDEVDAGIGGRAGVAVGRRLARLARRRQVLAVTHLPQIACFADRHFRVTKRDGTATVEPLDGEDRVEELSRMLSGLITEETAGHAEELLAEAAREKA